MKEKISPHKGRVRLRKGYFFVPMGTALGWLRWNWNFLISLLLCCLSDIHIESDFQFHQIMSFALLKERKNEFSLMRSFSFELGVAMISHLPWSRGVGTGGRHGDFPCGLLSFFRGAGLVAAERQRSPSFFSVTRDFTT